jgi:hypothetical protein
MFVVHAYIMAEDEDENIVKKVEQDKGYIEAEKENRPLADPAENLAETEKNMPEARKTVTEDEKSGDTIPRENIVEREPAGSERDQNAPEKIQKGIGSSAIVDILPRKPILIILIIGAIILGGFLLYSQIQLSNQSYKVENYNALWNQSLADLRGGNTSLVDYCKSPVHDDDLCKRFMNLQYMG